MPKIIQQTFRFGNTEMQDQLCRIVLRLRKYFELYPRVPSDNLEALDSLSDLRLCCKETQASIAQLLESEGVIYDS